jgi:hypothetical protein
MIAQKNVTNFFYTSKVLSTAALPSSVYEIGVRRIGESLCDNDALVAGDQFQVIGYNVNGAIIESPIYTWNNLINKNKVAMSPLVSQVSHIGYNGSDGDIVATNSGNYLVTLGLRDTLKMVGGKRLYKFSEYQAGTTAKNYNIAIALAGSLDTNMSKDAFKRIVPAAICSSTVTAANGFKTAQTTAVVKGSKVVTATTNVTWLAGGGNTLVVGDYLRIGTVGSGTALTDPVYKVVAISSLYITLDRPVTNASGTYTAAGGAGTSDIEVIAKATAEGATIKWGLSLTGNDSAAPFVVGMFGPNLIQFSVGVSTDFGTSEVRLTTTPFFGTGTYKQLAQIDWELQKNTSEPYRIAEHLVPSAANVLSSDTMTYVYTLNFKDTSTTTIVGNTAESYMTLMIASDTTADAGQLATVFGL